MQTNIYICISFKTKSIMKATIENLKANRDLFISTLVELFGQEVLVSKMSVLKNQVEFSEMFDKSKEIEDIIKKGAENIDNEW